MCARLPICLARLPRLLGLEVDVEVEKEAIMMESESGARCYEEEKEKKRGVVLVQNEWIDDVGVEEVEVSGEEARELLLS